MKINIQQEDEYTNIGFDGAVDLSSSSDARKSIIEVLEQNKNILIDLSLVGYIDSSGVASLVEGYQIAKKRGKNAYFSTKTHLLQKMCVFAKIVQL